MELDRTYLFYSDISCYQDPALYQSHYTSLPEKRQEKVNQYRKEKDQQLSVGVYRLHQKVLSLFGLKEEEMKTNEYGKPVTDHYYFSFSHSGSVVFLAISPEEVGCDVEEIKEIKPGVLRQCFTGKEQEYIRKDQDNFFRLWCMKESYLKAIGTGIRIPLKAVEINPESGQIENSPYDKGFIIQAFKLDGYLFSVTSKKKEISPIKYFDIKE